MWKNLLFILQPTNQPIDWLLFLIANQHKVIVYCIRQILNIGWNINILMRIVKQNIIIQFLLLLRGTQRYTKFSYFGCKRMYYYFISVNCYSCKVFSRTDTVNTKARKQRKQIKYSLWCILLPSIFAWVFRVGKLIILIILITVPA